MPRKNPNLSLDSPASDSKLEESYQASESQFSKDGLVIDEEGVNYKGDRHGGVSYADLDILEKLGSGACGFVKKCRDKRDGRSLAVKFVSLDDKSRRAQIMKEIHALLRCDCVRYGLLCGLLVRRFPGVSLVQFHGCFYHEGFVCIALEFMDCGSLDRYGGNGNVLSEFSLANTMYQVFFGLSYLEYEKRVHRDIKPQNILLNHEGRVKLSDFGISKELGDCSRGLCETFVGTFRYMSPERMEGKAYFNPSDIWSIGLVIFECTIGVYPYRDCVTPVDIMEMIKDSVSPSLPSSCSAELRDLVDRCLRKDVSLRLLDLLSQPTTRPTARELLGHPWLKVNGAIDHETARENTLKWLRKVGEFEI